MQILWYFFTPLPLVCGYYIWNFLLIDQSWESRIPEGGKIDFANCKCPVVARLIDVQSPKRTSAATTTEAPIVTPTRPPPPTPPPPPMPSLPPLPPFRSSVEDLQSLTEGKIRGIANHNSGQGNLSQHHLNQITAWKLVIHPCQRFSYKNTVIIG